MTAITTTAPVIADCKKSLIEVKLSPFSNVRNVITPRMVPGRLGLPFLNIAIPMNTAAIEFNMNG